MTMKRSSSEISSSPPLSNPSTPNTPKKTKSNSTPSSPSKNASQWTPEKKEKLVERLLTIGIEHAKLDDLASETGLSKKQISDALCRGRKANLRQRLIDFAKTAAATGK